jgi:hypothetical protein
MQNMVIRVQDSFPYRRFKLTSAGLGVRPSDKWPDASLSRLLYIAPSSINL